MCQEIYVASDDLLPEINWNEKQSGFYFIEVDEEKTINFLQPIVKTKYIYEALSYMGCACGLFYHEYSKDYEDYLNRVNDVQEFIQYLKNNSINNQLFLFSTSWDKFPDKYESIELDLDSLDLTEFSLEENVIMKILK